MKKLFIRMGLLLFIIYIGTGTFLYLQQRTFLYHPTQNVPSKYNTMVLKNDNEKINIIVLNEGHKNAILYFGGNAESMAGSSEYIAEQFPDFTVYLMDYRGYGASTGEATEKALYSDALKLYDSVKERHERISIGGRSLGTAIATYVAAHREVSKLALITPFDSIVNVAKGRYPLYPVALLLHDKYDSASRAKDISAKTFIVIAQNDRVIAKERTQELIDAFSLKHLKITTIANRGHNDISSDKRYYKIMQDFIGEG
jgi:esterase/lipase